MELIFLLIFIAFIFLNVVLGLISSRAKKRKQMEAVENISDAKPEHRPAFTQKPSVRYDSFLGTQTAESIVKPLYQEPEKAKRVQPQKDYEGPTAIPEKIAPTFDEIAPFPGGKIPAIQNEGEKSKEQEQPFYQKRVAELIEAARQRADSRTPMVDLTGLTKSVEVPEVERKVLSGIESQSGMDKAPYKPFQATEGSPAGATEGSPVGKKRDSSNLLMLVQRLPSLQKAVVLSEILGRPKGMSPHNDQR